MCCGHGSLQLSSSEFYHSHASKFKHTLINLLNEDVSLDCTYIFSIADLPNATILASNTLHQLELLSSLMLVRAKVYKLAIPAAN